MRNDKRVAFTLVELLLALAASTTVLVVAIQVIERTFASYKHSRELHRTITNQQRLAWQLRRDAMVASSLLMRSDEELQLQLNGKGVTYSVENIGGVTQVRRLDDGSSASEIYTLGNRFVEFTQSDDTPARLIISRPTKSRLRPKVTERVVEIFSPQVSSSSRSLASLNASNWEAEQ